MRVRFAPSPTGNLHVGNARTALFNWLLARGSGGRFILRIEDTDVERSSSAAESSIYDDLRWLGLDWDEGPDIGGERGPYRQSERLDLYHRHANRLLEQGDASYCFCSPEQLEAERREARARGVAPRYSGRCRMIAVPEARARVEAGEPAAVRFRVLPLGDVSFDNLVRGRPSTEPLASRSPTNPVHPRWWFLWTTPGRILTIGVVLSALVIACAFATSTTINDRQEALTTVLDHSEPLAFAAGQLYTTLSVADAAAATAFIAGAEPQECAAALRTGHHRRVGRRHPRLGRADHRADDRNAGPGQRRTGRLHRPGRKPPGPTTARAIRWVRPICPRRRP